MLSEQVWCCLTGHAIHIIPAYQGLLNRFLKFMECHHTFVHSIPAQPSSTFALRLVKLRLLENYLSVR